MIYDFICNINFLLVYMYNKLKQAFKTQEQWAIRNQKTSEDYYNFQKSMCEAIFHLYEKLDFASEKFHLQENNQNEDKYISAADWIDKYQVCDLNYLIHLISILSFENNIAKKEFDSWFVLENKLINYFLNSENHSRITSKLKKIIKKKQNA